MPALNRRTFLQAAAAAAVSSAMPSVARAASIPAAIRSGTLADVEHIVVLMQENRSFDHYFGTLNGVRGFGDPRTIPLRSGENVWHQADNGGKVTLPFRPDEDNLGLTFIEDLNHDWNGTHSAWNKALWDNWIPAKGTTTMAYLTRRDIPFHYALADAFTVCDAYHCSMLSSTDPNRYYLYSGWVGNDGSGGGPVLGNEEAGYGWTTFPEILERAGVSWKLYQDSGEGLDEPGKWGWTENQYIGNYGDNSLLYFDQYRNAAAGDPLFDKARTGTSVKNGDGLFDRLRADVQSGDLPSVSWIAAPEAYCEHPSWPANYGAWYISGILDALTSNPDVWSKTALLITYDENDGFFDHVPPPVPPLNGDWGLSTVDTAGEIYTGGADASYTKDVPYGLGPRVPLLVVSPWSVGGWVCSQTFDHTSVIQLIEQRFGVHNPNISDWRRAVCGDLTHAFDFTGANSAVPNLPDTGSYAPPPDHSTPPDYHPVPPETGSVPAQESGLRKARALPYDLVVDSEAKDGRLHLNFTNSGAAGAAFHITSTARTDIPWVYTVGAGQTVADSWELSGEKYQLSVFGPNGWLREFGGAVSAVGPEVTARHDAASGHVTLSFANPTGESVRFTAADAYDSGKEYSYDVAAGGTRDVPGWGVDQANGWYDVTVKTGQDEAFVRRAAGHVETGAASTSDPAITAS
ncbi:phosphocholine-specific phospholipase C [Amycolatopsis jiangsuensis]|uniref:phospholipase C n=1 Tax=Amycolatopsis jiangsuensis TaxID=1181879 RepID=A0A840IN41_9PSEU|nr:phospholipase C, phosphocholine-specific [Amycolatopsis jiangsuensis]MBB4682875.1 phospholipase C [Amycolatopsis jiangsuensis]